MKILVTIDKRLGRPWIWYAIYPGTRTGIGYSPLEALREWMELTKEQV